MKDRVWCEKVEAELQKLQSRVTNLERKRMESNGSCSEPAELALEIELPEADIGGLHFNKQTVRGVFERGEDGNYYSRDILFNSARDTDKGTGRDLLSEYLESSEVKQALINAMEKWELDNQSSFINTTNVKVFLPEALRGDGIKKYNGVDWWYWLKLRSAGSSTHFVSVTGGGGVGGTNASSVGGCALAFCVV